MARDGNVGPLLPPLLPLLLDEAFLLAKFALFFIISSIMGLPVGTKAAGPLPPPPLLPLLAPPPPPVRLAPPPPPPPLVDLS